MNTTADMLQNAKIAGGVAAATTGTGLGTILDLIPDDIGKLATLVGAILAAVLIYTHLRRMQLDRRKILLEIAILEQRETERRQAIEARLRQGGELRREEDQKSDIRD